MERIVYHKGTPYTVTYDDADHEMLSEWNSWRLTVKNGKVMNVRLCKRIDNKSVNKSLHRVILGIDDPRHQVDHEDRNPLNNHRYNLRDATHAQNMWNRTSFKNSSSKYLGVSKYSDTGRWVGRIMKDGVQVYLGSFISEEDAARAYDKAAKQFFGEFANLNFKD